MSSVLINPLISEKSITGITEGRYTFKVLKTANKAQIAQEIEDLYKVKVTKVNVISVKDEKLLIKGRFPGRKKGWKKAIITLKKGQKIPGFEEK